VCAALAPACMQVPGEGSQDGEAGRVAGSRQGGGGGDGAQSSQSHPGPAPSREPRRPIVLACNDRDAHGRCTTAEQQEGTQQSAGLRVAQVL